MADTILTLSVQAADAALQIVVNRLQELGDERWRDVARAQSVLAQFERHDTDPVGDGLTPEEYDAHEREQDRLQREHDRAMDERYA